MEERKKRKKFQKGLNRPVLSRRINVRLTEDEYKNLIKQAHDSPQNNISAYSRHKLLKGDKFITLNDAERGFLMELVAARTDIKRFTVAVDAATKTMSDELRKNYILSLGVQRMWSPAVNRVFSFIADFLDKYNVNSTKQNIPANDCKG